MYMKLQGTLSSQNNFEKEEQNRRTHTSRLQNLLKSYSNQNSVVGFPGGAVVKNLPANAGDAGSSPGPGRSHMPWSGWARAPQLLRSHEPQLLSPHEQQLLSPHAANAEARVPRACVPQQEKPPHHSEECSCSPQLKRAHAQQQRPNAAKKTKTKNSVVLA